MDPLLLDEDDPSEFGNSAAARYPALAGFLRILRQLLRVRRTGKEGGQVCPQCVMAGRRPTGVRLRCIGETPEASVSLSSCAVLDTESPNSASPRSSCSGLSRASTSWGGCKRGNADKTWSSDADAAGKLVDGRPSPTMTVERAEARRRQPDSRGTSPSMTRGERRGPVIPRPEDAAPKSLNAAGAGGSRGCA